MTNGVDDDFVREVPTVATSITEPTDGHDDVLIPKCTPQPTTKHPLLLSFTPGGSQNWIRRVEEEFMPKLKMTFIDLESAMQFYVIYALACGFETRRYSTTTLTGGVLHKKLIVCNRQGFRETNRKSNCVAPVEGDVPFVEVGVAAVEGGANAVEGNVDAKPKVKRRNKISRIGCPARMRVMAAPGGGFIVDDFVEHHNHQLCSLKDREFQQLARNLTLFHKKTILDHSKLKIGASRTFHMCKEYADGYSNVGATLIDFKNFHRDVKCFIGANDAQLFINRLKDLCTSKPDFYFSYEVDDEECLSRVFWADPESRKNYSMFGDSMSFDATYGTNKYFMIFAPFTGVDHHKRSVFFAGCLLAHEDDGSYEWCFKKFLDCMGQKEPRYIITDQDPALKNVVPAVFKTARHRFCMWHIMQKVAEKVGPTISKETDFLSRLNSAVWDPDNEPSEFEEKWMDIMRDFNLEGHKWLSSIFRYRANWIPAYFRDLPMGGILRTTQRSESENSNFKRFENHFGTLVEFWMRFESAIEQQRYSQKCLDKECLHSLPVTVTPSKLESHAATVYTHKVFNDVQLEIKCSFCYCGVGGLTKNGDTHEYDIEDELRRKSFQVVYTVSTNEARCACKLFESKRLLCRHIFCVLTGKLVKSIPQQYILSRWIKNSLRCPLPLLDGNYIQDCDPDDIVKVQMSKLWSEIYATVSVVKEKTEEDIKDLTSILKCFREKLNPHAEPMSKDMEIEKLLGCNNSSDATILPPRTSKNKGSGKRLVSNRKEEIAKSKKPKRLCANCKQMAYHDKRNCPEKDAEVAEQTEEENLEDGF